MEKRFLPEIIKGNRISIKKHTHKAAQKMYQYVVEDRERLAKYLPWPPFIKSVDDELSYINDCDQAWKEYKGFHFGIYRNNDDEYLGNVGCFGISWNNESTEIGYWILGKFEGKGYMSEAVSLLEEALFEIGFNRLVIRFQPGNLKSGNIPRRLHYHYEGALRQAEHIAGEYKDLEIYSKLKAQYCKSKEIKAQISNGKWTWINDNKAEICEKILRVLPQWFGIESAIQYYVKEVCYLPMLTYYINNHAVGFLSIKKHNDESAEIYVMGVLPEYHRRGIGEILINQSISYLKNEGVQYLQVKTLGPSRPNEEYALTRNFYHKMGFVALEELIDFWCEGNPCLIMVKRI